MQNHEIVVLKELDKVNATPVVAMVFGSHLYGLNTPDSDYDYKGIYIPRRRSWVLNDYPKSIDLTTGDNNSRNTADDVDISLVSIQKFIQDAMKGEVFAIDMLHCENPIFHHPEYWTFLRDNRTKFYSKSMKAYIGYLKRQVHKYGVKGSRIAELETIYDTINVRYGNKESYMPDWRIENIVNLIPFDKLEFIFNNAEQQYIEVLGKKFGYRAKVDEMLHSMSRVYNNYGARAQEARDNKGVDWKAVSHALRAGYQQRDIFLHGDFKYPLDETGFLLKVKTGEMDFVTGVQPELDHLAEEVTYLAALSDLPDKPDVDLWNGYLYTLFERID